MDPVALTEALPFLVCTVGFDKPLRLARAVFAHPHLTMPPTTGGLSSHGQLKPSGKIILESLSDVYKPIIRDYALEVAVLVVGANSQVSGLREVCALAAVLLAVDCMLLCTFLASIFGVMIEVGSHSLWSRVPSVTIVFAMFVCPDFWDSDRSTDLHFSPAQVRRIKTMRAVSLSRSSSSASLDGMPRAGTPVTDSQRLRKRVSMLLGVKGSMLPGNHGGVYAKSKDREYKPENPVARLKLLLVCLRGNAHFRMLIGLDRSRRS